MDCFKHKDKSTLPGKICTFLIAVAIIGFLIFNFINVAQGKGGTYEMTTRQLPVGSSEAVDVSVANNMIFFALTKISAPDEKITFEDFKKHGVITKVNSQVKKVKGKSEDTSSSPEEYRECTQADFDMSQLTKELYDTLSDNQLLLCPDKREDYMLQGREQAKERKVVDIEISKCDSSEDGCDADMNQLRNMLFESYAVYDKLNPVSTGQEEPLVKVFSRIGSNAISDNGNVDGTDVSIR